MVKIYLRRWWVDDTIWLTKSPNHTRSLGVPADHSRLSDLKPVKVSFLNVETETNRLAS